ncbi:MAG: F0F1 ATP synthase subunit B [Chromatiales bacterium 21-64-14]|nr:MAG: F0F1 ATP synthase subunit B [Chromatiales bacterium 21-64-14]HQU16239.1 F0F1 ATP synthase subunit B [Gammaproteobacteria bacterium]
MNVTSTLIGQMITFAVLVWFVMRFLWKPLSHMMEERSKRIADGLAAAERGLRDLELAQQRVAETLREAKTGAAEVITQAQRRAAEIVDEAKTDAREEGQRILTTARSEIDQEVARAKEELRRQVAGLAVIGAERILKREIDAKVHNELLKDLAEQI